MNADGSEQAAGDEATARPTSRPSSSRTASGSSSPRTWTTRAAATSTSTPINVDGSGLERVTFNDTFDGFPMFSPDGKKLVFASNRNAAKQGDTNIFIADWVD